MQASVRQKVLVDAVVPNFGVQTRVGNLVRDVALVIGSTSLMALCAQIAIKIPTTTVPITGQTFGAILIGAALGSKRGASSMLLYLIVGIIGMPIFAPSPSPLADTQVLHFILPWSGTSGLVWNMTSGGYIVGFVLGAYLIGLLAERGWDRRPKIILTMLLGNSIIYLIGLPWLAFHIATNDVLYEYFRSLGGTNVLHMTLRGGLYPFIGGDAIKLIAAALLLPGTWALVDWVKDSPNTGISDIEVSAEKRAITGNEERNVEEQ